MGMGLFAMICVLPRCAFWRRSNKERFSSVKQADVINPSTRLRCCDHGYIYGLSDNGLLNKMHMYEKEAIIVTL